MLGSSDDPSDLLSGEIVAAAREKLCVSFEALEYEFLQPDQLPPDDKMGFVYAEQPPTTPARDFSANSGKRTLPPSTCPFSHSIGILRTTPDPLTVGKMRAMSEKEVARIRKFLIRSPLLVADEDLSRKERMQLWEDIKTKWNERNDT